MKKKLSKFLSIFLISILLISIFSIFSYADEYDWVEIPDSYYTLVPKYTSSSNFVVTFDDRFYAGSYPDSFRTIQVVNASERGSFISFDPGGIPIDIVHISSDGVVTWSEVAISYSMWELFIPSQEIYQRDFNFLESYCIRGASPGIYYLNVDHVFNNVTYSYDWVVSASLDGSSGIYLSVSVADGYYLDVSDNRRYYTNLLYFEGDVAFSGYQGYVAGWDGSIEVITPLFFTSAAEMLAFYSTFDSSISSPGGNFNAGFEKGEEKGYADGLKYAEETLKPEWEAIAKQEGIEEGRNFTESANLGKNLLGNSLQVPFNSLMNLHLFTFPDGSPFTFGTVFATIFSLSLLIIFLKMFAGG